METAEKHRMVPTISIGNSDPGRQVGDQFMRWYSNCGQQNEPYGNKRKILLVKEELYFQCFLYS